MNSRNQFDRWMLSLSMARIARTEKIKNHFCKIAAYYNMMYVTQKAEEKIRGNKC